MAHRYETVPLTQDNDNNSTDSDIETQTNATHLELFPPPPFPLTKTDGTQTFSENKEQTPTAEVSIWASVVKRQAEKKEQEPPVATTVNDPDTSNQDEQHESISNQSEKHTLRQPIFSDKGSNESEHSNAPLTDDTIKAKVESYIDTVFTTRFQAQIETYYAEWKSERQSETHSQEIAAISKLQPVTLSLIHI